MLRRFLSLSTVALLAAGAIAWTDTPPAADAAKAGSTTPAKAWLDRLKTLEGSWQSGDENGDGKPDTHVFYRVVSGGSAVAEFLMPGDPHEMVSVYHLDGDQLMMTHYCALGNQPRMKAVSLSDSAAIKFDFVDGTNMKPTDMHIHSLTLTMVDSDHITADWRAHNEGKEIEHGTAFKLERVKDAAAAKKIADAVASPSKSVTPVAQPTEKGAK
ncbi:MAG: hypothetical protein SF069_03235 [Phycisphaerae bacterium]|nr:hypothetical protein [Phycisphaerae bacterium]